VKLTCLSQKGQYYLIEITGISLQFDHLFSKIDVCVLIKPRPKKSCYGLCVMAFTNHLKGKDIPLSVVIKDTTSKLAGDI